MDDDQGALPPLRDGPAPFFFAAFTTALPRFAIVSASNRTGTALPLRAAGS